MPICDVYWNLNRGGYSIRAVDGPNKGRVIGYAAGVDLINATFKVQAGGRDTVRRKHVKSVHAWVRGELVATHAAITPHAFDGARVTYNPYKYDTFVVLGDGAPLPIESAASVSLRTNPETGFAHVVAR
jgi:hypothetical protein